MLKKIGFEPPLAVHRREGVDREDASVATASGGTAGGQVEDEIEFGGDYQSGDESYHSGEGGNGAGGGDEEQNAIAEGGNNGEVPSMKSNVDVGDDHVEDNRDHEEPNEEEDLNGSEPESVGGDGYDAEGDDGGI